jgi:hypothetical protein
MSSTPNCAPTPWHAFKQKCYKNTSSSSSSPSSSSL